MNERNTLPAYACFVAGSPMFDVIVRDEKRIRMCFLYENAADAGGKDVRPVVVLYGGAAEGENRITDPYKRAIFDAAEVCAHAAERLLSNGRARVNQVDRHTAEVLRSMEAKILALGQNRESPVG